MQKPTPVIKESAFFIKICDLPTSYLHQMVDVIAYFAKQLQEPNLRVRDKGAHRYFCRLAPINLLVQQQPKIWGV